MIIRLLIVQKLSIHRTAHGVDEARTSTRNYSGRQVLLFTSFPPLTCCGAALRAPLFDIQAVGAKLVTRISCRVWWSRAYACLIVMQCNAPRSHHPRCFFCCQYFPLHKSTAGAPGRFVRRPHLRRVRMSLPYSSDAQAHKTSGETDGV